MINVLFDGYPEDYKGYLIRTDYRIALQILQCFSDEEFSVEEKYAQAAVLLFGNGAPNDWELIIEGITWFVNGGNEKKGSSASVENILDFEVDNRRIRSAFLKAYGIDIAKEYMHYFDFLDRFNDIGECAMSNVMKIRTEEIDPNMSEKSRLRLMELKREFSLDKSVSYTEEEQEQLNIFMDMIKNG